MGATYSILFTFFVSLLAFPFPMKSSLLVDVFWAVLIINIRMGQVICNYLSGQTRLNLIGWFPLYEKNITTLKWPYQAQTESVKLVLSLLPEATTAVLSSKASFKMRVHYNTNFPLRLIPVWQLLPPPPPTPLTQFISVHVPRGHILESAIEGTQ